MVADGANSREEDRISSVGSSVLGVGDVVIYGGQKCVTVEFDVIDAVFVCGEQSQVEDAAIVDSLLPEGEEGVSVSNNKTVKSATGIKTDIVKNKCN